MERLKDLKYLKETVDMFSYVTFAPYSIASRICDFDRFSKSSLSIKTPPDWKKRNDYSSKGLVLGLAGIIGQYYGYKYALNNGHPELIAIPFLTNIYSAVKEEVISYKEMKKRLKESNKNG